MPCHLANQSNLGFTGRRHGLRKAMVIKSEWAVSRMHTDFEWGVSRMHTDFEGDEIRINAYRCGTQMSWQRLLQREEDIKILQFHIGDRLCLFSTASHPSPFIPERRHVILCYGEVIALANVITTNNYLSQL